MTIRSLKQKWFMRPFRPIIPFVGKVVYTSIDGFESLFGLRDDLTPPRRMIFIGNGNYKAIGNEFVGYFKDLCNLKPDDSVLDVGCGLGRMAAPLTQYLSPTARYEGFDIVEKAIDWATKHITAKYPNFRFTYTPLYNKLYTAYNKNHTGNKTEAAEKFRFPYEDESFDLVYLTSVFTHMLPADLENYMSEIRRVLKKGGKCLITYFLLNKESLSLIDEGKAQFTFQYKFDKYQIETKDVPEDAIAYDETYIKELYQKYNLQIQEPIRYGMWCGRKNFLSGQDIIIAQKQ